MGILDSLERDFGCFEEIEFEVLELLKTMKLLKVGMLLGALFEEGCASICTGLDSKVHYFKWPLCVHNPKQNGGSQGTKYLLCWSASLSVG